MSSAPQTEHAGIAATLQAAERALRVSVPDSAQLAEVAYAQAEALGDVAGSIQARVIAGYAAFHQGQYAEAKQVFCQVLPRAQQAGLQALEVRALNGRAVAAMMLGHYDEAIECNFRAYYLVQESGDLEGQARSLNNIGVLFFYLREYGRALEYHRQAAALATRIDHAALRISALLNIALDLQEQGEVPEALRLVETAVAQATELEFQQLRAVGITNAAHLRFLLGDLRGAWADCEEALALTQGVGLLDNYSDNLLTRGRLNLAENRLEAAQADLTASLEAACRLSSGPRKPDTLFLLAEVAERRGNLPAALDYLRWACEEERSLLYGIAQRKAQAIGTQLNIEHLEAQAKAQAQRNEELSAVNRALKEAQQSLVYQANHDLLTGLPNRRASQQMLDRALESGEPPAAVLLIDLDHFKQVNETLGHPAGDVLLRSVGQRLRESLGSKDLITRQGGDEFMVILGGGSDPVARATQLLESLGCPLEVSGHQLTLTASIGVAVYPEDGGDATTLKVNAELALYKAKRERHSVQRYFPALSEEAAQRLALQQQLRAALQQGSLELHFQPIVSLETGRPSKVEALTRWMLEGQGFISPLRFLPLAEESDLILQLGTWVLQKAVRQLAEWRREFPDLQMSVNVSPRQFAMPDFAALVAETLSRHGVSPEALILEITENALTAEEAFDLYAELQRRGLQLAVDDVGTGYSNLALLCRAPAQLLKIDRSLTEGLCGASGRHSTQALVRALVVLAHERGMQVVAEGVEGTAQVEQLRALGCDAYQGYLASMPLPAGEMTSYLRAGRAANPSSERRN
ncbi:EAL domain-containing protein [Deinococcus lacus]|uniref:EAL domain-containing protein n=1 Tax=Deinococcus lacus TaxID=392561 RepID=A0ABW1YFM2_9DEIO